MGGEKKKEIILTHHPGLSFRSGWAEPTAAAAAAARPVPIRNAKLKLEHYIVGASFFMGSFCQFLEFGSLWWAGVRIAVRNSRRLLGRSC